MQGSRTRFERLGENEQKTVEGLRSSIFFRWASPATTAEGKLEWDDDLAVLFVDYGFVTLDEAIRWHRQNSERRPSIAAIREQCRSLRERSKSRISAGDAEHNLYLRDVREHLAKPENDDFVPVALIFRDTMELLRLKAEARDKGYTPKPGELDSWRQWRSEETRNEWRAMRKEGVVGLRERRAGDTQGTGGDLRGIGAIACSEEFRLDSKRR